MNQSLSTILRKPEPTAAPDEKRRKPDLRSRLATFFPWLLVVGFVALLGVILGDRLIPARELPATTVVTVQTGEETAPAAPATAQAPAVDPYEGPMLFQASGWVEPDPYPTTATTLVNGVVDTVDVLEGETVEKGQLLATLVDDDAELDLQTSRHQLASLKAQAEAHQKKIAGVEARLDSLEKRVEAAKAREEVLADPAQRLEQMTSRVVAEQEIVQAKLELAAQKAEVAALSSTRAELQAEVEQLTQEARNFQARIAEAETQVARDRLALERTRITSPISGVVSVLHAAPGRKKVLAGDNPDSAVIAVLYEPEKLQARIDVPLAEAGQLEIGQPVRLRSNILPNRVFEGIVTRIVGEADLQRNTLQAKVRIHEPDPRLRPEMLCRAEFLAPPAQAGNSSPPPTGSPVAADSRAPRVQIYVPTAALTQQDDAQAIVWKFDESGERVRPQTVKLGASEREGFHLVQTGLNPGDRVLLDPPNDLSPGERIRPVTNDNL